MKLLFIDAPSRINNNYQKSAFLHEIKKYKIGETKIINVKYITGNNIAFISPANSFLFMNGGIDNVYSREMWDYIEGILKIILRNIDHFNKAGKPYLPVGSAIINPVGDSISNNIKNLIDNVNPTERITNYLISAPTMYLPQDVSQTNNAYWAFYASLKVIQKSGYKVDTLVVPGLCCGYGNMDPAEVARQINQAYQDFNNGVYHPEIKYFNNRIYFNEPNKDEQPKTRENYDL